MKPRVCCERLHCFSPDLHTRSRLYLGNLPDGFSTSVELDVFQTGDILFKQFTSAEDKLVFILYSDSYIYILLVILVMPKLI